MSSKGFCKLAAVVFALVAVAHALRMATDVPIHIGTTFIPAWASWLGFIVTGALSFQGFRSSKS